MVDVRQLAIKIVLSTLVLAVACGIARNSHASSTLTIAPSSEGVYELQGVGMDSVAAMDITVSYDSTSLTNPRVTQGSLISGAMLAVNDLTPGQVRLGIIRSTAVTGTGSIASITFDRTGSGAGKILSLSATFSNVKGKSVPVLVQVTNAADETVVAADQGAATTSGSSSASAVEAGTTGATLGGVLVQPGATDPGQQKEEIVTASTTTEPETTGAEQATASSREASGMTLAANQPRGIPLTNSVLDRFREYRGERTVKALVALFEGNDAAAGFRQEPKVVLSDGKAVARVIFIDKTQGGARPDFALRSARLISMKRDVTRPDTWVAEVKPDKGASSANVVVAINGALRDFPLTVAPKAAQDPKAPGKITKKSFSLYLSGKGRDLNRDGKRDYIDDYIYAANYVAAQPVK